MTCNVGTFDRGSTIDFAIVFKDAADEPVDPTGATLTLAFSNGNSIELVPIALTPSVDHKWIASWESVVAAPGKVDGHAVTDAPTPFIAVDFYLTLTANAANVVEPEA